MTRFNGILTLEIKMKYRLPILILVSILSFSDSVSQNISNKGKEFWLSYGYCWVFDNEFPTNSQELVLYLSAEQAANVTVSVTGTGWSQSVSIPANTVNTTIKIPKTGPDDARLFNEGLSGRGVHIVSDTPIVVYAHFYNNMVSGATMLLPVESYGYKYYSLNYSQSQSGSSPPTTYINTTQNGPQWTSWFYVIAAEDNTRIEITPSDTTKNGWLPGQTYTVNLNKGQVYNVMGKLSAGNLLWQAGKDLTGSKILSVPGSDGNCHKIAMFSGSSGIRLCKNDGGEFMQQQVFPTQAWGTRYLTYHTLNNQSTDINDQFKNFYRIAVSDPATVVRRNGVVMTGLINNTYYEYLDSLGGDYIEADKPILMAQYTPGGNRCFMANMFAYGDPEMFYLSPLEQGKKDVLFYATRNANIDYNYLNVIVKTAGVASLRLDGNAFSPANIKPHPNHPGYSVAVARILGVAAQHRLTCDSTFNGTMYGLGFFESYGYNVGTFINNLNHYSEIKNVYNTTPVIDTFTCLKTPVRLYVKVGYPATSIHWKLSQVPNMTPNTDSIIINPTAIAVENINGRTYYVYTLQQDFIFTATGTYTIPVSYTANVIENCNQTEYAEVKIEVRPGPVSDFTVSSPACLSDSVYFTGAAVPGTFILNNYIWTFPDMTTANTVNAVKLFATAGIHNIRYQVIATNGCVGDTSKPITVLDNPIANFGIGGNTCSKDSVYITDSSSIITGSITNWKWDMGDGNIFTKTNSNPFYHHYTTAGTYVVSLIATSNSGCKSDTVFKQVTIYPSPTAKFGILRNICAGDSVLFRDSSSVSAGTILSWQWNFGDAASATYNNNNPFYHTYTIPGTYPATLIVLSSNGCMSDTFRLNIIVASKPSATASRNGVTCVDSLHSFISSFPTGTNSATTWYWDFGDGQTFSSATTNLASHGYSTTQTNIIVKHVVSIGAGCTSDTAYITIPAIYPNPVASFTVVADTACVNKPVQISSANTNVAVWNWNFGNGNSSNAPPFIRSYSNAGNYNISLQVTSTDGCRSAVASQPIIIHPNPMISAGPDKFITPGGNIQISATNSSVGNYNYSWSPSAGLNSTTILSPVASPSVTTEYIITTIDAINNCVATDKVIISVITGLFVPNAFTPNGDGINDKWQIPGLAVHPNAVVSIYNRSGALVYQAKDYYNNPWDGTYRGTAQPATTFVYMIKLNDPANRLLKGTVTLIR